MMKSDAVGQIEHVRRPFWLDLTGASLLFVGLLFASTNLLGWGRLENWWGLFILLPGLLLLGAGWGSQLRKTQPTDHGRLTYVARFSIGSGLVVVVVALMFLINLNWGIWWPLMIMTPGVALWLVGGGEGRLGVTAVMRMGRWFGFMMFSLGLTFLVEQLAIINLQSLFGDFHWWGFFIFIPGIGAFVEALRVLRRAPWAATGLLIVGVWLLSAAVMEILDPNWISWEGMVGIGLIGTGLMSRVWLLVKPADD